MGKTQYTQKFREEWLTDPLFKDWLMKIELDQNKARCRFCKTEVVAKRYDLVQHTKTKKHIEASKAFATSRSIANYAKPTSSKTSDAEGTLALFIAVHCSILTCNHLGILCESKFIDSEAAKNIKLHRTKCTNIIINILSPHFETSLRTSIGNQPYSILVDESTDISVTKYLGITIMYFNKDLGQLTSTYLALIEMESCDAEAITTGIKTTLKNKGLDL
ncbi:PREDICTED: uncharacterized protein LOC107171397 [Diuraphis noxia]|uniref:uncharacterized protein LOC107171397 n=1 Tax=Diuraphis noxia TaxID=143948 RepID=UPI0007638A5D|nr:PREDICTED: uncharacterized protein LOC107171397 [Diuraphis noxia]